MQVSFHHTCRDEFRCLDISLLICLTLLIHILVSQHSDRNMEISSWCRFVGERGNLIEPANSSSLKCKNKSLSWFKKCIFSPYIHSSCRDLHLEYSTRIFYSFNFLLSIFIEERNVNRQFVTFLDFAARCGGYQRAESYKRSSQ